MSHGYALRRNDSCQPDYEIDCGSTWGGFHACCPMGTYCPPNQQTTKCWKSQTDQDVKRCANGTWDLYYARDFFCCDRGSPAFMRDQETGYVGCADPDYKFDDGQVVLSIVAAGTTTTTTTGTVTSTSTSETITSASPTTLLEGTTPLPDPAPQRPRSNTGAIAGGVVGGVTGLALIILAIWLILRRRRRTQQDVDILADADASPYPPVVDREDRGLQSAAPVTRIKPSHRGQPVYKIYGKSDSRMVLELPATVSVSARERMI